MIATMTKTMATMMTMTTMAMTIMTMTYDIDDDDYSAHYDDNDA